MNDESDQQDATTRIAEIDAREAKATKGPWVTDIELDGVYARRMTVVRGGALRVVSVGQTRPHHREDAEANAEFIAYAREDVPWLLAAIARVQEERDEAKEAFKEMHRAACEESEKAKQAESQRAAQEATITRLTSHLKDLMQIRGAYGYLSMQMALSPPPREAFRIGKKEWEHNEDAFSRTEVLLKDADLAAPLPSPPEVTR